MLVKGLDKLLSLDARGSFGRSFGMGKLCMGFNYLGFDSKFAGIYSKKKTREGSQISLMKFYVTPNPRTVAQQAWRAQMALAWSAYALLTTEQKNMLHLEARRLKLSGPNLFVSRYLKANRL